MNVAFCASEVFPFAKTGGLADVCGALPIALDREGITCSVFMPLYREVKKRFPMTVINRYLSVRPLVPGIMAYFINHEEFFDRDGLYGTPQGDYPDNLSRFQFFAERVLQTMADYQLNFDIIHCHDWQAGLIPAYVKHRYAGISAKVILTIHNLAYQGVFPGNAFSQLGLSRKLFNQDGFEFYGQVNLLKGGIVFADEVTTVSPRYAQEITTPEFGCGLDGVLRAKEGRLEGILNGIDYDYWDPRSDPELKYTYHEELLKDYKSANKRLLQERMGLTQDPSVPIFGLVGRLSDQKGIHLVIDLLKKTEGLNAQFIVQGVGSPEYVRALTDLHEQNPRRVAVEFDFNENLAHNIYAASDFFLMPSHYEPCGLSQMISMRYGTVPIVFHTGGLIDSVTPVNAANKTGTGFVFHEYTLDAFRAAVQEAANLYKDTDALNAIRRNALKEDFSWKHAAKQYRELYQCVLSA